MEPTPERFRRLARSAPYRWNELLLEGTWAVRVDPVRVHVERPDAVRVTGLDGTLLHQGRTGSRPVSVLLTSDGSHVPSPELPSAPPELDGDGLVTAARRWREAPEVPYWQDYRFVAVLDPYELAEGVDVLEVRLVEHGGRPAWEALLRPTQDYDPRCPCCALLFCRACDDMMDEEPQRGYADAHLVRLDVGSGICVRTREVGGPYDGTGHELVVLTHAPSPP